MAAHRTILALGAVLSIQMFAPGSSAVLAGGGPSVLSAQPQEPGPEPGILILGSTHMAQTDREWDSDVVRRVVDALEDYDPDMVVVEHLPPEWPKGRGRDYRPGFDLEAFAERWGMETPGRNGGETSATAPAPDGVAAPAPDASGAGSDACARARRLFLRRDLANAAYEWLADGVDCPAEAEPEIAEWLDRWHGHEMARIAFPVARSAGLDGVVSFDYQGDDVRWFFGPELLEEVRERGSPEERAEADSVRRAIEAFRAAAARHEEGSLLDILRARNAREWIEDQRHLYEDVLPHLGYEDAGARQTANYWLRNRRMFDRVDAAAAERDAERILVVVGAGHKYFLDELARERGFRWVDPLRYLGEEAPPTTRGGS